MTCASLKSFLAGHLSDADHDAFGAHLAWCDRCQKEMLRSVMLEFTPWLPMRWREDAADWLTDRLRRLVDAGIGVVGLGWSVHDAIVRALMPEPVRSWVNWTITVEPGDRPTGR